MGWYKKGGRQYFRTDGALVWRFWPPDHPVQIPGKIWVIVVPLLTRTEFATPEAAMSFVDQYVPEKIYGQK